MSLNVPAVDVVSVMDPRLEVQQKRHYVALKGAQVNNWQQFPATTRNNSNVQISCNPPSREIGISRLVFKRFVFTATVTGTNTSLVSPLLVSGYYAPRCMPIASITQSETVQVNNAVVTQAPIAQYWPTLMWYNNEFKNRNGQYSLAPSMLDQAQDYSQTVGTARNPLGVYGDTSFDQTRGSYAGVRIISNPVAGTTAQVELTVVEPIFISPFVFGEMSNYTSSFGGVQNMSYTATIGNLQRILSLVQNQGAPGVINITGVSVELNDASLLFNYFTPDPLYPIPRSMESSYFNLISYPTRTTSAIAPGAEVTIAMQSIQVASIPRRIWVFARRDDSSQTAFTSDAYFGLAPTGNPLTLQWNNNIFMSTASTPDLYNIAVKNGCEMSYSQFINQCGTVLNLEFGTDIGLAPDETPGVLGNYQLSLTCRFVNRHPTESIIPTLYCVVASEGVFNIVDGSSSQMIGVLSRQDVLNAQPSASISYGDQNAVFGGSFFSKAREALSKIHGFVKGQKLISKGLSLIPDPRAQAASKVAAHLGYGASGGRRRGRMRGAGLADVERVNLSSLAYDDEEKYYDEY